MAKFMARSKQLLSHTSSRNCFGLAIKLYTVMMIVCAVITVYSKILVKTNNA